MPHSSEPPFLKLSSRVSNVELVGGVGFSSANLCEQIVEVPVPKAVEEFIVRCAEHLVAVPAPHNLNVIAEEVSVAPHMQKLLWMFEQRVEVVIPQVAKQFVARFVAAPVPLILEENVEMARLAPHGQISERICEQIGEGPVPQTLKEIVEVASVVLQKRTNCCCASASEVREIGEAVILMPHAQFCEMMCEQIVEVLVARIAEEQLIDVPELVFA